MEKYGPAFVAFSKKTGRLLAHAKEFGELWDKVEEKPLRSCKAVVKTF